MRKEMIEEFSVQAKNLGFSYIDVYTPDKKTDEVVAITFSKDKKYVKAIQNIETSNNKKTLKQWIKFLIVGVIGVIINGFVFAYFTQFSWGQIVPIPYLILAEINIAWGFGILVSTGSNFILDKFWVFQK